MRALALAVLVVLARTSLAQEEEPLAPLAEHQAWEFSGSVFYSEPPGSEDRLTPILYADRGNLHLEARYNYEDLQTFSIFGGWTFASEGELAVAATPMLGAAFGETEGVVPALELDVGWRRIAWYAEMEWLIDLEDRDDDFFYSWSTLTYGFTEGLSAGLVVERSKLVDTDTAVQPGLALELSHGNAGLSLYAYDLGTDDAYLVVALGFGG